MVFVQLNIKFGKYILLENIGVFIESEVIINKKIIMLYMGIFFIIKLVNFLENLRFLVCIL